MLEKLGKDTTGSLGCAITEAVEHAVSHENTRYVLGSVLNQVLLHQSIIGLESKAIIAQPFGFPRRMPNLTNPATELQV